jgi:hypothetical protein
VQLLVTQGFQNVKELTGGFYAWTKAEYPATTLTTPNSATIVPVSRVQLGLNSGETVIEFWLKDLNGVEVSLLELLSEKPVMLEFGSYTCPQFRQQVADTESLMAKYRDQIQFIIVYVIEPYPVGSQSPYSYKEWILANSYDTQGNPIAQPQTYEERVKLASLCIKDAGITALVLVDEINNPIWQIYGPAPNLAYLIGTDDNVIEAQIWYNAAAMETAIDNYLNR